MAGAVPVNAYCRNCDEIRYHSTRQIMEGEKLVAELFAPAAPDVPLAENGKAPTCHICQAPLQFVPVMPVETSAQRSLPPATRVPVPASPNSGEVKELFRLDSDESLVTAEDTGSCILIVTSRRVVKIAK